MVMFRPRKLHGNCHADVLRRVSGVEMLSGPAHCVVMSDIPTLLKLSDKPVLSQAKAVEHSTMLTRVAGFNPDTLKTDDEMNLADGRTTTPKEDVEAIRATGAGAAMQDIYDAKNSLFNLAIIPVGFSTSGAKGFQMTVSAMSPVASAGRPSSSMAQYHPLAQLIDDVIHMRRLCAQHSTMALHCLPFYRSYLSLCIAVVDCFVNYCSKYFQDANSTSELSDYVNELLHFKTPQERKLEILWNVVFLSHNEEKDEYLTAIFVVPTEDVVIDRLKDGFANLKNSPAWECYANLKDERNKMVHPTGHIASIYIENIMADLNKCRGIGEVLLEFARHQNYYGELGCLRKLAYAPLVECV